LSTVHQEEGHFISRVWLRQRSRDFQLDTPEANLIRDILTDPNLQHCEVIDRDDLSEAQREGLKRIEA
jgi:hypothetical protein